MVRLCNLYGHPLAGLSWQQHSQQALFSLGWELVKGWESLYKHTTSQLFLSVYVDDFKMAGRKSSIKPMWEKIRSVLDIDPPQHITESTYLGCRQKEFAVDEQVQSIVDHRRPLITRCLQLGHQSSQGVIIFKTTSGMKSRP